jgi:hypothetical protein
MVSPLSPSYPLLVIGSGTSVVTWDCRHDAAASAEGAEAAGRRVYKPFAPKDSSSTSTNAGDSSGPRIADLAWNHNGQGACVAFLLPVKNCLYCNHCCCDVHHSLLALLYQFWRAARFRPRSKIRFARMLCSCRRIQVLC